MSEHASNALVSFWKSPIFERKRFTACRSSFIVCNCLNMHTRPCIQLQMLCHHLSLPICPKHCLLFCRSTCPGLPICQHATRNMDVSDCTIEKLALVVFGFLTDASEFFKVLQNYPAWLPMKSMVSQGILSIASHSTHFLVRWVAVLYVVFLESSEQPPCPRNDEI